MTKTLRGKLVLCFLVATLAPLGLTVWLAGGLLEQSVDLAPVRELSESAAMLEKSGKAYYATARELLKERVERGGIPREASATPLAAGEAERILLEGDRLVLLRPEGRYSMALGGVSLPQLQQAVAESREVVEAHRERNFKRGFFWALAISAGVIWLGALAVLLYWTGRVLGPIHCLTQALRQFGQGQRTRLEPGAGDEVGEAIASFNDMALESERSREKLLLVTRLESWQALGRKMAHEVKNSLTPIRLTVEEMVARSSGQEKAFLEQAAQIVTDEVQTLERRVKAFSELASEPPLAIEALDLQSLAEERLALLSHAHPEVVYRKNWSGESAGVAADADLVKGILTNLLENAADAAGRGGVVRVSLAAEGAQMRLLIEDSGPGLSLLARETLFQPTISFKRSGMGLGLSIAKRSALLMGGDLELADGSLGGAAFALRLPAAELTTIETTWQNESSLSTTKKTLAVRSA
jgi:nitrogen fixation/metabolism regulation signal transduction histidine kinase